MVDAYREFKEFGTDRIMENHVRCPAVRVVTLLDLTNKNQLSDSNIHSTKMYAKILHIKSTASKEKMGYNLRAKRNSGKQFKPEQYDTFFLAR